MSDFEGLKKCLVCGYIAPKNQSRDVRRHIESRHIRMVIECNFCGKNLHSRRNFEIHLRNYHSNHLKDGKSLNQIVQWHVKDVKFDVVFDS